MSRSIVGCVTTNSSNAEHRHLTDHFSWTDFPDGYLYAITTNKDSESARVHEIHSICDVSLVHECCATRQIHGTESFGDPFLIFRGEPSERR